MPEQEEGHWVLRAAFSLPGQTETPLVLFTSGSCDVGAKCHCFTMLEAEPPQRPTASPVVGTSDNDPNPHPLARHE